MALSAFLAGVHPATVEAQGTTTGAITGTVTDAGGRPVESVQIEVVNQATGFRTGTMSRANGRYFVQNLEVGGPYRVTARRIGYTPETNDAIRISLGQATRWDIVMREAATQLTSVKVTATAASADFAPTRQGAQTIISDTLLRRIPTLNRDVTDLARLSPQVTTNTTGGPSAAGGFNRFNSYTIDGSNQNDRFNLNSTGGTPGGSTGGRIVPIDAVKEVQVLLSPTDVRYGNFVGMNLNAVTRSGTNTLTGGATYTFRNPSLAYDTSFVKAGNLRQQQEGFYLGGPIIKDRLHFFTAVEWQQRSNPNSGASIVSPTDVSAGIGLAQIDSVVNISKTQYNFDPGTASVLQLKTPLTNFMGRLDWQATGNTRVVFRQLINTAQQVDFSRNTFSFSTDPSSQGSGVRLTSNQVPRTNDNYSSAFQVFSNFAQGLSNEFSANYNTVKDVRNPPLQTPEISIKSGSSQITLGTEQFSPVNLLDQRIFELMDNVTVPLGAHTVTLGARYEYNKFLNDFEQRVYGAYKFASIADYAAGNPLTYSVGFSNGAELAARFRTNMYSTYAQDQWAVGSGFTLTYGVRVDVPSMPDTPAENPTITQLFAAKGIDINTATKPKTRALFSPRVGFNWDVLGNQTFQLRGNAGLYTGQPPYVMIGNAYQNTGMQLVFLNCGGSITGTTAPGFTTDVHALPTSCAGQAAPAPGTAGTAGINLNDPNLKFPQRLISTLGFDKALPGGVVFTGEALYGKDVNGLFIRDLNLLGPKMAGGVPYTDRNGRVIYADSISATNSPIINSNSETRVITRYNGVNFNEGAVYLTNQSKAYNYSFTGQLRKRFGEAFTASGSYTYGRSYDVQSLTSDRAVSNFRNGRTLAGLESEPTLGTSAFERRHAIKAYGTYTAPWKKWATDFSLDYSGVSGIPITYTVNGDLNGDGVNGDDPIYVPKNVYDPSEIRFNGTAQQVVNQQAAFERFISSQPCLNSQRGEIMARNSCRGPWRNLFNFSVRQSLPEIVGQRLTAQLDIFNFGNLLNPKWGHLDAPTLSSSFPQQQVLIARGRTGTAANPVPLNQQQVIFDMAPLSQTRGAFSVPDNSTSSLYQMQLTFRYSF